MKYIALLIEKFGRIVLLVLLALVGILLWIYDKIWEAYYFPQGLYFMGGVTVLAAVVLYLLRLVVKNIQFLDDLMLAIWNKWIRPSGGEVPPTSPESPSEAKIVSGSEWMNFVIQTYGPGRRKPALPLGFDESGNAVEIAMTGNESHLMITGGTGLGKGVLMNQFIIAAAASGLYQVVVVSRSGKDYRSVADLMANVHLLTFGHDPSVDPETLDPMESVRKYVEAVPLVLRSVYTEVARRQNLCEQHRVTKISDIRPEYRPPHILIIIEEFADTAAQIKTLVGNKAVGETFTLVGSIAKTARASSLHLCLINQSPVGEIPRFVRKELRKATFATDNSTDSYWTTDVNGAGAEHLYRYSETQPGRPGELMYIGGNTHHILRPAFTNQNTLEMAARMATGVKNVGEPTWIYGWNGRSPGVSQTAVMRHNEQTIVEPQKTVVSAPVVNLQMPVREQKTVVTKVERPSSRQVFEAAGWLFDNHDAFADYRGKSAFNRVQAQAIMVILHSRCGMPKTSIIGTVFPGRNGRYTAFYELCEKFLVSFERHYKTRLGDKA